MPQKATAIRGGKKQKKREERKLARSGVAQKKEKAAERREIKQLSFSGEGQVALPPVLSVGEFAEKLGAPVVVVISELLKAGIMATINQSVDFETMAIISEDMGFEPVPDESEESLLIAAEEDERGMMEKLLGEDKKKDLEERPPVISVMGHVDHGKTSLLDALRKTDVASGEAGGITQHIGAYQVDWKGRKITFLDTPGHAAFTAMRARGARATDIAILVVAANDGVKPQTIEAINHAKAAGIPIVVAVNKIDLPEADVNKVKSELAEHDLTTEEWGGKTVVAEVSAKEGKGIDELLDLVLLTADLLELKANPKRAAVGTVIESDLDPKMGPIATVLVNTGTLKIGDPVVVGAAFGKVRSMMNEKGKRMDEAGPSAAVRIAGLDQVPAAGEILTVKKEEKEARSLALKVRQHREAKSLEQKKLGLAELSSKIARGDTAILKVVVKTDVDGSLEAVKQEIAGIKSEKASVSIIHAGVGAVNESDVMMAAASEAVVLAFHTGTGNGVKRMALREGVEVKKYEVIYHLVEDLQKTLLGMMSEEVIEEVVGKLKVKAIFMKKATEMVVGGDVIKGKFMKNTTVRVWRLGEENEEGEAELELLGEGKTDSVQCGKVAGEFVEKGDECGLHFIGKVRIMEGDILESVKIEKKEARL